MEISHASLVSGNRRYYKWRRVRKSVFEHVVGTVRVFNAPEQEQRKAFEDYRTLPDEEIEER